MTGFSRIFGQLVGILGNSDILLNESTLIRASFIEYVLNVTSL